MTELFAICARLSRERVLRYVPKPCHVLVVGAQRQGEWDPIRYRTWGGLMDRSIQWVRCW